MMIMNSKFSIADSSMRLFRACRWALLPIVFCIAIPLSAQQNPTAASLSKALKEAIEAGDSQKVESIKKEIKALEEKNAEIKTLEEDKQILIFQQKYDEVPTIEEQIAEVKAAPLIPTEPEAPETPTAVPSDATQNLEMAMTALAEAQPSSSPVPNQAGMSPPKKRMRDYEYNDKAIVSLGSGMGLFIRTYDFSYYDAWTGEYYYDSYSEEYPVFAFNYTKLKWWLNKYMVLGPSYEYSTGDYGNGDIRMHGTLNFALLGNFVPFILPYASMGAGVGVGSFYKDDYNSSTYVPLNYRVGSYLFFDKARSFGLYFELNRDLEYEELPGYRFGLSWSKVKRKAKRDYKKEWWQSQQR